MHPVFLFAGFFFFAVSYNLLGPLATNIMQTTGLSLSGSGTLVSFQQIGSLISMAVSLLVMKRLKQGSVMKIGYLFLIVALVSIALSSTTTALFIFYLILGLGSFLVDSASNATLASEYYEKRSLYIPLLHFCYSIGAIATGYLILPFKGVSWRWAYGLVGVAMALILITGSVHRQATQKQSKKKRDAEPTKDVVGPITLLLKDRAFILYTLVIMFYMGSQVICATWIPVYIETELGQSASITGTSLTVFWIGTALSRLIVGPIMNRGANPFTLSIWGMFLAGISLVGATLSASIPIVLILVLLCGFFAGATIPMYVVIASTWYPRNTAFISLSYIVSGTVGRMIFPYLVAKVASFSSLGFALMLSSLMLIISAFMILGVRSATRNRSESIHTP
ncbi:MAG TPA: MFS transporter [Sphaerochaeta sp.]|nr:MFS transporter [Spirochaetota bacterium]HOE90167.1 MFS transporter [Sphaerochaeta sp.]HOR80030.1 MFS transporter [Sphaerochaeta sp.]